MTALVAGGITVAGIGGPLLIGEKEAVFEPNNSYWAKEQPAANPTLQEDLTVDVAIIGGGYTGLATAWHLATSQPSLNIILLEARQVGHGASGRHGGMVLPQLGVEAFEIASDLTTHKQLYDLTVKGMKSLQKLVKSKGIECDLRLDGYLYTFLDEEDLPYYEEYVEEVQQAGLPLELWDEDEVAEALGTEIYSGGVYDPNGGSVHAMKLVKVLKAAAEGAGVRIFGDSPVLNITEGETMLLQVGKAKRTVRTKAIVLATNGYTSKLGYFKYQVMPVHVQTAVTPPLSPAQLETIGWESRLPFYDSREYLYHLVLTPDNRIVIGGGAAEYCFANDLRYCQDLTKTSSLMLNQLISMYPPLKGIQFEYVWDGILGVSFDDVPVVGVMGKYRNIYYGLGYSGQGVNLSFVFGEIITALYQGKQHDWLATSYANYALPYIPPEPYRWIGGQGAAAYYHWLDNQ